MREVEHRPRRRRSDKLDGRQRLCQKRFALIGLDAIRRQRPRRASNSPGSDVRCAARADIGGRDHACLRTAHRRGRDDCLRHAATARPCPRHRAAASDSHVPLRRPPRACPRHHITRLRTSPSSSLSRYSTASERMRASPLAGVSRPRHALRINHPDQVICGCRPACFLAHRARSRLPCPAPGDEQV